jgi:DNA-binding CsgD family transcriptional regulator
MLPATIRPLTARQRALMERIDRRIPIKVIALEMGVSETRINQHIRALKDIFDAASLFELVENYRIAEGRQGDEAPQDDNLPTQASEPPFSEIAYNKKQVFLAVPVMNELARDDLGRLEIGDVMPLVEDAPWLATEPKVVPGLLNGEHAVLARVAVIMLIAIGVLAGVVLIVTAGIALSSVMDGKAYLPV